MGKRKRGRPRNADSPETRRQDDVRKDEIIGRCVGNLIWFGFPQRGVGGVFSIVAERALTLLDRHDHTDKRLALSADRVEQIYEQWKTRDPLRQWKRKNFTKDSLQARSPNTWNGLAKRSLFDLATEMLRNGGRLQKTVHDMYVDPWTGDECVRYTEDVIGHGDAEMTPKAYAEYLEFGLSIVGKQGN